MSADEVIVMRTLLVLLLLARGAMAQGVIEPSTYQGRPSDEQMVQWLGASDPRLVAWGARDVLVNGATDLLPAVESALDRAVKPAMSSAARKADYGSVVALLDTLIQMNGEVPVKTLEALDKLGYGVQAEEFVLLKRLPRDEAEGMMLGFYKPESKEAGWLTRVAAQLLEEKPPAGFAAEMMRTVVVSGNVVVHDTITGYSTGWASGCGSCIGSGDRSVDWPVVGRYSLIDPPKVLDKPMPAGETVFLDAVDRIDLLRNVGRSYAPASCRGIAPLDDAKRSHLIGALLRGNPVSPFPGEAVTVNIEYTSRETYRARVQDFVDEQERNFAQVASALTAKGLMSEKERQASALRISLRLTDVRVKPAEDLPVITFRPPVVWVAER